MPEIISRLRQQIMDLWQNLDKSQKNRLYITSGILVVAIAAAIVMLTRPNYTTLIRNADAKEVGQMTKVLDDKKIWYKVSSDQSTITINAKDNNKAQAALVQQGLPKSTGMTFDDAFNMIKITTTESEKRKIWEVQEEANISAKLKMLDNVEDASVDLALPEATLFISDDNAARPTASVMIKPKGDLTAKQVQGVVMMVARSVEKLDPKDVTVVDNNLNILNSETGDPVTDNTNSQIEMTQKKKLELEKGVRDIYNGQFDGFDAIRVIANPVLDFNKLTQQTQGIRKPEGMDDGAIISQETSKESLVNNGTGGAPGTDTNPGNGTIPSYPTEAGENSTYNKDTSKVNRDYTRYTTAEEKALGLLDTEKSSMTVTLLYGKRVTDDSKLTQAFIDQVKKDVSSATGIPVARISVNKYKIAPPEVVKKSAQDIIRQLVNDYGFFALMLLLLLGLAIAAFPKKKVVPELEPVLQPATAAGPRFVVPEAEEELPDIEFEDRSEVKKQIDKFVKQKPEAVAQLLRNWISDEWD